MLHKPPGAFGSHEQNAVGSTDPFQTTEKMPTVKHGIGSSNLVVMLCVIAIAVPSCLQCGVAIAAIWRSPDQATQIVEANGKALAGLSGMIAPLLEAIRKR